MQFRTKNPTQHHYRNQNMAHLWYKSNKCNQEKEEEAYVYSIISINTWHILRQYKLTTTTTTITMSLRRIQVEIKAMESIIEGSGVGGTFHRRRVAQRKRRSGRRGEKASRPVSPPGGAAPEASPSPAPAPARRRAVHLAAAPGGRRGRGAHRRMRCSPWWSLLVPLSFMVSRVFQTTSSFPLR